jgi:hypothetical protein
MSTHFHSVLERAIRKADSDAAQTRTGKGLHLWVPPLTIALFYPLLISWFTLTISAYHRSSNPLVAILATLIMTVAGSLPLVAGRALLALRDQDQRIWTRAVLLFAFAASELFTVSYTLFRTAHIGELQSGVWIAAWAIVGILTYFKAGGRAIDVSRVSQQSPLLRVTHGIAASLLLCGFLIPHLFNHSLAVWSISLHTTVLRNLRLWYRSEFVEPVLFGIVLIMILTGLPMVLAYCRGRLDTFRVVQVATGVFLGIFIVSHVLATLLARGRGVDTNWFFAAGPKSLLDGTMLARLIPHYTWVGFVAVVHVACGLRVVLLGHGVSPTAADRVFASLAFVGMVTAALTGAALMGVHIRAI